MLEEVGGVCKVPKPNSFVPGTLVLMADGTTKAIEEVQIGDWVLADDPETGERGARQVIDLITGRGEKQLIDIELGEDGIGVGPKLTATDTHPFWVVNRGAWVDAGELVAGDLLRTDDGQTVLVEHVTSYSVAVQTVHNLTVDGIHTYFVVAGHDAVLVHNCVVDPYMQRLSDWAKSSRNPASVPVNAAGEQAAIRARVLANIEASKASRLSSNFDIHIARTSQVGFPYGGVDAWGRTVLPKGSIVYGGYPGPSAFYTDLATVKASKLNVESLFKSLQVSPHPVRGYRPQVRAYRLLDDIEVPSASVLANPQFGSGGGAQFYIQNFRHSLQPIRNFNLSR